MAAKFTRLSVLAFHLFSPESDDMLAGAVSLFTVCTEILDLTARLDATQSFAWYSTHYHMRMILLAAFCVLRIMRSKLREVIPVNEAEQSLFKAINFVKSRSTHPTDLDAKYAIILKQLFSSTTAFRGDDGEIDGLHLDIRSRLVRTTPANVLLYICWSKTVHEHRLWQFLVVASRIWRSTQSLPAICRRCYERRFYRTSGSDAKRKCYWRSGYVHDAWRQLPQCFLIVRGPFKLALASCCNFRRLWPHIYHITLLI